MPAFKFLLYLDNHRIPSQSTSARELPRGGHEDVIKRLAIKA